MWHSYMHASIFQRLYMCNFFICGYMEYDFCICKTSMYIRVHICTTSTYMHAYKWLLPYMCNLCICVHMQNMAFVYATVTILCAYIWNLLYMWTYMEASIYTHIQLYTYMKASLYLQIYGSVHIRQMTSISICMYRSCANMKVILFICILRYPCAYIEVNHI